MLLSARLIVIEHWPRDDGRCPICKLPHCRALSTALAYLEMVNDPFVPADAVADVVDIDGRTAPAEGAAGAEPVDGGEGEFAG
ncbi:hypothetical protein O7626_34535 [Micromonospora sp. WMMD1102]|nr:hypothetical protein [Micromonospora sp. WMMD1102]MDG4790966.1 hypothetical protein [Micromonospora sp. WMMD1102]